MDVVVRRVESDDWTELKAVRLAALADAPFAFGSTYAREADLANEEWVRRAARAETGSTIAMFLAWCDGAAVGIAGGHRPDPAVDVVELVSMWTAPEVRRSGFARLLIEAVVTWARDVGAESVSLWVTEGNEAATALYLSSGFRVTDGRQPLPSDPTKSEDRLMLSLASPR